MCTSCMCASKGVRPVSPGRAAMPVVPAAAAVPRSCGKAGRGELWLGAMLCNERCTCALVSPEWCARVCTSCMLAYKAVCHVRYSNSLGGYFTIIVYNVGFYLLSAHATKQAMFHCYRTARNVPHAHYSVCVAWAMPSGQSTLCTTRTGWLLQLSAGL